MDYFKMTPFYQYMVEKNCFEIYDLAYGISDEEIAYSKNTLYLATKQMIDIQNWFIDKYVKQFIVDINDWNRNKNTLKYYKYSMCENMDLLDVDFYTSIHNDLRHMPKEQAISHYYCYGIHEKRLTSEKHFYELYSDFDVDLYRSLKEECKHMSNTDVIYYYYYYGKFYEMLDVDFYTSIHNDLRHMPNEQAKSHYHRYGIHEKRLASEKHFYELYPDFDVDFYRSLNEECKHMSYISALSHYYYTASVTNKKYIDYDFIVNDDYVVPNVDDKINKLISNHYTFRCIDTYEKLIDYLQQNEKKYYIYNKESFYTYYYDFDYEYYKNKYFKTDHNSSEKDILLYYHLKGKYENHTIHNKINIVMYTPPYNDKCGGIMVMHYFCKLINEKYNDKFCAKLFMYNNLTYKNPFCNQFARIDEINDNTIVIYPEIVSGNPLHAKNVVRWILLELGIEMPLDHYKKWSESDIIYHWENIDKQLCCPFYNKIFTNKNVEKREKTCYLVKKGPLIHKNIHYIHPENSICIDNLSLQEKANIFNECTFFYTYDPNTAYIIFSAACGCIPIIYPMEGVSEEDYFKTKMFNFNNQIYNRGIVYGNNIEKINDILENKLNENNETYYRNLFTNIEEKTFLPFLEDIYIKV